MKSQWHLWIKGSTDHGKGSRSLLASAFAFSLMTVCVKQLKGRIPIAEILLARALFSLLITQILLKRLQISPWGINKRLLLLRGCLGTGALFCVFYAISTLPLNVSTVLQYTYPTFTAIAGWIFLKEKMNNQIFLAVILGWIGVTLVVQPNWIESNSSFLEKLLPITIGLTGALLTALAYICVRQLSRKEHQLVIIYYFPLVSIPITIPFLFYQSVIPTGLDWAWLLGVGVFTQLGQIWVTQGLSKLPASRAGSINYIQVLFASLWGLILFKESLNSIVMLGALFVLAATMISLQKNNQDLISNG